MSLDDGLPLPHLPYHFPPVPGPKPVPEGTGCTPVRDLVEGAKAIAAEPTERWNSEIPRAWRAVGSKVPQAPVPKPRIDGGRSDATPATFKPVDRSIDKIGAGVWETVGALSAFFVRPVGTAVHDIYSARINAWQKEFLKDHGLTLRQMTRMMSIVEDECEAMRDVVHQAPEMDPRIDQIMKEKGELGDRLLKDVEDCLRKSEPGPDRDALEDLWKRLREWMAERNARVEADRREVLRLHGVFDALKKEATELDLDLRAAATEAMRLRVAAQGAPLVHASPEAAIFAAKLRAYLMATRQRLDDALSVP